MSDGDDNAKYSKVKKKRQQTTMAVAMLTIPLLLLLAFVMNSNSASSGGTTHTASVAAGEAPSALLRAAAAATKSKVDFDGMREKIKELDGRVRAIRKEVKIFEQDAEGQEAANKLQQATREFLTAYYGSDETHRYRVKVELEFQKTIVDFDENGKDGTIMIELAPSRLQPHSIHTFLEVSRTYHGGAFHRIAPHVLQTTMTTRIPHLAFQEYSKDYPHKKGTVGYAGRPSGPAWYVSTENNVQNHGPGSQQKANPYEADSCFGTVIEGFDDVVQRIRKVTDAQGKKWPQFLGEKTRWVIIKSMTILVFENGGYKEWEDPEAVAE